MLFSHNLFPPFHDLFFEIEREDDRTCFPPPHGLCSVASGEDKEGREYRLSGTMRESWVTIGFEWSRIGRSRTRRRAWSALRVDMVVCDEVK
jgi:hypothetical protein